MWKALSAILLTSCLCVDARLSLLTLFATLFLLLLPSKGTKLVGGGILPPSARRADVWSVKEEDAERIEEAAQIPGNASSRVEILKKEQRRRESLLAKLYEEMGGLSKL